MVKLVVIRAGTLEDLVKSHVKGYTRKDGSFVKEHDDKRQKKAEEQGSPYSHPHVVGKANITDEHSSGPHDASTMQFAGTHYNSTGKSGKSFHDETPVREFESEGDGHRVWMDHHARVHADSKEEVPKLRAKHEAHVAGQAEAGEGGASEWKKGADGLEAKAPNGDVWYVQTDGKQFEVGPKSALSDEDSWAENTMTFDNANDVADFLKINGGFKNVDPSVFESASHSHSADEAAKKGDFKAAGEHAAKASPKPKASGGAPDGGKPAGGAEKPSGGEELPGKGGAARREAEASGDVAKQLQMMGNGEAKDFVPDPRFPPEKVNVKRGEQGFVVTLPFGKFKKGSPPMGSKDVAALLQALGPGDKKIKPTDLAKSAVNVETDTIDGRGPEHEDQQDDEDPGENGKKKRKAADLMKSLLYSGVRILVFGK